MILDEQPNRGQTIIEKLERHSSTAFAVVLLTGDDIGGLRDAAMDALQARARQNVILELGYMLGKLGRPVVAALYEPDVELPSDYRGVVYIPIDPAGEWKQALIKEFKAAELPGQYGKFP